MKPRIYLPLIGILLLAASCRTVPTNGGTKDTTGVKDTTGSTALTSAIDGLVLKGPISPVEHVGVPNTAPLPGATISVSQDLTARKPTTIVSDSNGRFYLKVTPGSYTLTPQPFATSLPRPEEASHIIVPTNTVVKDTLLYDTGIR